MTNHPGKALTMSVLVGIANVVLGIAVPARSAPLPAEGTLADATATIIGGGGEFGHFVDNGGDLTGDGIADLVVGAPREGIEEAGRVYVFEGGPELAGSLSAADSYASFEGEPCECQPEEPWDWADSAGTGGVIEDIDGDGNADLIVTASGMDGAEASSGGAYIFYGPLEERTPEEPMLEPDASLHGASALDGLGLYELEIGDVNGDDHPDIVIGGGAGPRQWTGSVYIIYGTGDKLGDEVHLEHEPKQVVGLEEPDIVELWGTPGVDLFLGRHTAIGELDGNAGRDLVLCAEGGLALRGHCYILYGGAREQTGPIPLASDASIIGSPQDGVCCAAAADHDADGLDDIVIGAYIADDVTGYNAIFYSDAGRSLTGDHFTTEADATIWGKGPGDVLGFYASAGDLNADGVTDIVVTAFCENNDPTCEGAPLNSTWSDGKGALYVFYGNAGTRLQGSMPVVVGDVRIASEHPGDSAGFWFEAGGDVTGDGIDDLVIGAPSGCEDSDYQEGGCTSKPGATYVVAGGCLDPHKANHGKPKHCWK